MCSAVRSKKEGSVMHTKCESHKIRSLIIENFPVYDKGYGKNTLMLAFAFLFFKEAKYQRDF